MSRCKVCKRKLRCPGCTGAQGGGKRSAAQLAALTKNRRRRWQWQIGQAVRAVDHRWEGTILAIGAGRGPRRILTIHTTRHDGAGGIVSVPFTATIQAGTVVRCPTGQKARTP